MGSPQRGRVKGIASLGLGAGRAHAAGPEQGSRPDSAHESAWALCGHECGPLGSWDPLDMKSNTDETNKKTFCNRAANIWASKKVFPGIASSQNAFPKVLQQTCHPILSLVSEQTVQNLPHALCLFVECADKHKSQSNKKTPEATRCTKVTQYHMSVGCTLTAVCKVVHLGPARQLFKASQDNYKQ